MSRRLGFVSTVEYYAFLVAAGWAMYKIKSDGSKKLQVCGKRVKELLDADMAGLSPETVEHIEIKSDMDALMAGRKQEQNNRSVFHVIRIGRKYAGYPTKISKQTKIIDGAKTLITQPPQLRHLRAMQRDFVGKLQPFLMDVIVDNDDVYRDADSALSIKCPKRPINSVARMIPIATPSPPKRAKTDSFTTTIPFKKFSMLRKSLL